MLKQFITTKQALQEISKRHFETEQKNLKVKVRKYSKEKNLTDKVKHLVKVVDQPIIKIA